MADTSTAVRVWMAKLLLGVDKGRNAASAVRAGERAVAAEYGQAKARGSLARVSLLIVKHVQKHTADDEPCTKRCLRHAINSRHRWLLEGALGLAIERASVVEDGGVVTPGSNPSADR